MNDENAQQDFIDKFNTLMEKLDEAAESEELQKTAFLRAISNELRMLRDKVRIELDNELTEGLEQTDNIARRVARRSGMTEVFVSLYCAEGEKLSSWRNLVTTLATTIVSRSIYKRESDAKLAIRAKGRPQNEAYCVVYIKSDDIAKPFIGESAKDAHGHDLVVLKRGAITPDNIVRFHHMGMDYDFDEKLGLVPQDSSLDRAS